MEASTSQEAVTKAYQALNTLQGVGATDMVLQRVKIDAAFCLRGGAVAILQFATVLDRDTVLRSAKQLQQQENWRVQTDETIETRAARRALNSVHKQFYDAGLRPRWREATLTYRSLAGSYATFDPTTDDARAVIEKHGKNKHATGANATPQGPPRVPNANTPSPTPVPTSDKDGATPSTRTK